MMGTVSSRAPVCRYSTVYGPRVSERLATVDKRGAASQDDDGERSPVVTRATRIGPVKSFQGVTTVVSVV